MTTVSDVPGGSVLRRQPLRYTCSGEPISMLHSVTLVPAGTSSCIQQCGLVHWKDFTVPCNVTDFWASNMALEWCASHGIPNDRIAALPSTKRSAYMFRRRYACHSIASRMRGRKASVRLTSLPVLLFHSNGFGEISRLVDLGPTGLRNAVGEELQRDIEQNWVEFGRGWSACVDR
jgi:hypothetical protein